MVRTDLGASSALSSGTFEAMRDVRLLTSPKDLQIRDMHEQEKRLLERIRYLGKRRARTARKR
jgi:hypothetical protein